MVVPDWFINADIIGGLASLSLLLAAAEGPQRYAPRPPSREELKR